MNKVLLVGAILLASRTTNAQWTPGVNLTTYDNVGIGTNAPNGKLDVHGNIKLNGGTQNLMISNLTGSESGYGSFVNYGGLAINGNNGSNRQMFMFSDGASGHNIFTIASSTDVGASWHPRFVVQQTGNVGIGTSTPGFKLDIAGNGTSTTIARISSGGHANYRQSRGSSSFDGGYLFFTGSTLDWRLQESSNTTDLHIKDESLGVNIVTFQDNTRNVGIGTSSPTAPLDLISSTYNKGLQIGTSGKNTKVNLFVADGDYGYLTLGGTTLRGNGYDSHFEGSLGIGVTNPSSPLEINSSTTNKAMLIGANGKNTKISMFVATGDYGYLNLGGTTILRGNGQTSHFDGKVGIGTTTTGTHKLAVEGTIGAREIKVEASGWSDFVFEKDYQLKPLKEVEAFITENQHLPEIPSEAEVTENGINLGEMDAKLLQKIEELTLYLIEQNKVLESATEKIDVLQQRVIELEKGK